jgi:NADH dehydrogenase
MVKRQVFVTGGTGYLGRPLIRELIARGHTVRALVRAGSESKLPAAAQAVVGNALDASEWAEAIRPADTLVHLVGTPHPSPWKGREFHDIDLRSVRASVAAAASAMWCTSAWRSRHR